MIETVAQRMLSRETFRLGGTSAVGTLDGAARGSLAGILAHPTFEVLPLRSAEVQVGFLPAGARVSVSASPSQPIETTVELAADLRAAGFGAVPHLAARTIQDRAHLRDLLTRIADAGVDAVFVVAGDGEPIGKLGDGLSLLRAMADTGHRLAEIGVPCYPQGHAFIPEERLLDALRAKAPFATYMTTQLCFDADAISRWLRRRRADGLQLPAEIGVPGAVEPRRLLAVAAQLGVHDTQRFLRQNLAFLGRMIRSAGLYRPDGLLAALAPTAADPASGIRGIHLYTFNQVEATETWRNALRTRLGRPGEAA